MKNIIEVIPTQLFTAVGAGVVSLVVAVILSKVKQMPISLTFGTRHSDQLGITRHDLEDHCDVIHEKTDRTINGIHTIVCDIKETLSKRLYEHDTRIAIIETKISDIRKDS